MSALANGTLLDDRYELLDPLDRGGMATVYRALDRRLDRPVAVKVLDDARRDATGIAFREDRLTARLAHPHIVAVFDGGTTPAGHPFLVMELIDGQAVTQLAPLPVGRALRIVEDVASAVAYTHERGIVHCDIKPQNILLDAHGQAKLADFGIASADQGPTGRLVYGSAPYLAPERLRGAPVGPAVDIYALGATLYFLLSGQPPHDGPTADEVIARIQTESPAPLSTLDPTIPPEVEAIVRRAMAPDPADRYPSAAALCDDLAALRRASGQTTSALRIPSDLATLAALPQVGEDNAATLGHQEGKTTGLPAPPPAATTTVLPPAPPPFVYPEPPLRERIHAQVERLHTLGAALGTRVSDAASRIADQRHRLTVARDLPQRLEPVGARMNGVASDVRQRAANWSAQAAARGRELARRVPPPSIHWVTPILAALLALLVVVAAIRTLGDGRTNAATTGATTDVPALIGLSLGDAHAQVRARGLALGRVDTAPIPGQPAQVVVYQQPPAGTPVEPGTTIDLVIRAAP